MAEVRYKKSLESIAVKIRDLAIARAPRSQFGSNGNPPGNLKRAIYKANTPVKTKMIKTTKNLKEISISLDYAPTGAQYGEFFNDPPKVVKRKALEKTAKARGNWNYAIKAPKTPKPRLVLFIIGIIIINYRINKMYLRYYLNEKSQRVYTFNVLDDVRINTLIVL